jgi:hypothetical protein
VAGLDTELVEVVEKQLEFGLLDGLLFVRL